MRLNVSDPGIWQRGFRSWIPEPQPEEPPVCPECGEEGTIEFEGDKYEATWWCTNPDCTYRDGHTDPRI